MEPNKSVPKVATPTKYAKTDIRYWNGAIFKDSSANYFARIQLHGKRRKVSLRTGTKKQAAEVAKDLHAKVSEFGWIDGMAETFGEAGRIKSKATLGDWIEAVRLTGFFSPVTLGQNRGKTRTIAEAIRSGVVTIGQEGDRSRFGRGPNADKWRARVDTVLLEDLTEEKIGWWRRNHIARFVDNPADLKSARISVEAYIRGGKSLFQPKVVKLLAGSIALPKFIPFRDVEAEKVPKSKYVSEIESPGALLIAGRRDLWGATAESLRSLAYRAKGLDPADVATNPKEQAHFAKLAEYHHGAFQILTLGLCLGLRREEIDRLQWKQVRWEKKLIVIEETDCFAPKADSGGEVAFDAGLVSLLKDWQSKASGRFVIEGVDPKELPVSLKYRAKKSGEVLIGWLRGKGITRAKKPIHALRKEFGAEVCKVAGVHAAASVLRHSDIRTTTDHYTDRRGHTTGGFGNVFLDR
jgi:integrase